MISFRIAPRESAHGPCVLCKLKYEDEKQWDYDDKSNKND